MGLALLIVLMLCFGVGAAAAFGPGWMLRPALQVEAGLVVVAGLTGVGTVLQRLWRRRWPGDLGWALGVGGLGLGLALVTFALGQGPGIYPEVVERTLDLWGFAVGSGGVAGAMAALVLGGVATASPRRGVAGAGLGIALGGLLALQPLLGRLGLPTVGPLGLLGALLAIFALRLIHRQRPG